ncbi:MULTISPECIES: S41 family peptidase [unclassified Fusibacter]|uniref:S41 family peptidase n=1 Tax=unclassified Fusibacter TaxID=2624464 RepID=UPI0010109985|nr:MULTISPECIES: S41 family peptidase [unclassified Fusibacter]MCK8058939.1 S41 family peptidase [Fusibacter sp. A2]NPE22015.1 hypothetical protein [Fusibacter sp. A1]RXV61580.1 hypothetical protein DWB64_09230 [Fusibacter sp. A1]
MKKALFILLILSASLTIACDSSVDTPTTNFDEAAQIEQLQPIDTKRFEELFDANDFSVLLDEYTLETVATMSEQAKIDYVHAALASQDYQLALKFLTELTLPFSVLQDLLGNKVILLSGEAFLEDLVVYQDNFADDPDYNVLLSQFTYEFQSEVEGKNILLRSFKTNPQHSPTLRLLTFMKMGENLKRTIAFLNESLTTYDNKSEVYELMAEAYRTYTFYYEGMTCYEKANELDSELYLERYILSCIDAKRSIKAYELFINNESFDFEDVTIQRVVESLIGRGAFDEASDLIAKMQADTPERMIWYLMEAITKIRQGELDEIEAVLDRAESNGVDRKSLVSTIGLGDFEDIAADDWMVEVFKDNYLYTPGDYTPPQEDLTREELARNAFDALKDPEDRFTFLLDEEEMAMTFEAPEFLKKDQLLYFKFSIFDEAVDDWIIATLDEVARDDSQWLILDMRGNHGGMLQTAYAIIDELTGRANLFYQVDKNGRQTPYSATASRRPFEKIIVLLDHESASSSEVVALSLKKRLKNVTIVGETSFGKGVGQHVFYDQKSGLTLYLVSFYWNVIEENIQEVGIDPDIIYDFSTEENVIDKVLELVR